MSDQSLDEAAELSRWLTLDELQLLRGVARQATRGQAFPLSKRECFAAVVLMGLASRLQPIHHTNSADKKKLVEMAFELANLALPLCDPPESHADPKDR